MKKLKITLGDGKPYVFSTFSLSEQIALKKQFKEYSKAEENLNKIRFEYDEEKEEFKRDEKGDLKIRKLTKEDELKIEKIEDNNIDFMVNIVRKSLCKNHPEFKLVDDKTKDNEILEIIKNIVDLNDLKDLTFFAFNGIYESTDMMIDVTVAKD